MKSKRLLLISSINSISPANYLLKSFQLLGCEVFLISDVNHPAANLVRKGSVDLSEVISERNLKIDFMLFVEGGEMDLLPINFQHLKFPKYWWGIDTHNDYTKHLRISRLFDHSFIAQKTFVELLRRDGIKSVSWLPLAYPENEEKTGVRHIDISYVGSTNWELYPDRGKLLSAVLKTHPNCFVGSVEPKQMFEIYQSSKIVFNHSPKNDINMRFFEAMGSGALLVTNGINGNGLGDIFSDGEDFITYSNSDDLVSKLNHLLSDVVELERIARNGMLKVKSGHTYRHRAVEILALTSQDYSSTSVDSGDFALALTSMGLYSDALSSFLMSLKEELSGRRNKLAMKICEPLLNVTIRCMKLFESLARRIKGRL